MVGGQLDEGQLDASAGVEPREAPDVLVGM
jgi:hypothetical protein